MVPKPRIRQSHVTTPCPGSISPEYPLYSFLSLWLCFNSLASSSTVTFPQSHFKCFQSSVPIWRMEYSEISFMHRLMRSHEPSDSSFPLSCCVLGESTENLLPPSPWLPLLPQYSTPKAYSRD